jgi:hypothetical protein
LVTMVEPSPVPAGSVKFPSGAIQRRNTSSLRNTTRTFAFPALSVYVDPSAAKALTSPSVVPAARAGAVEYTSAPASKARATTERFMRTKMLMTASLRASMNKDVHSEAHAGPVVIRSAS